MKKRTRLLALIMTLFMMVTIITIGVSSYSADDTYNDDYSLLCYTFNTDKPGFAEGEITLTLDPGNVDMGYYIFWAKGDKALENYNPIGYIDYKNTVIRMPKNTVIPPDATHIVALSSTDISASYVYAVYEIPESHRLSFSSEDALYTFGAISDVQLANDSYGSNSYPYDEDHLRCALDVLHHRGVDFTVSSGDTVNDQNGNQTYAAEYRAYQKIIADSTYSKPIYEANGNHDVGTVWNKNGNYYNNNTPFIMATGLDSKAETINKDLPYFEITEPTTGDHFIFMALEGGFYTNKGTQFSDAQLNWLEDLLKKYNDDGKNIFIIEHANVAGWGSGDKPSAPYYYDLGLDKNKPDVKRFINLMETYKDCIIITGHTHLELSAQYNYSDNNGTSAVMIHNSAIGGVRRLINGTVDRTPVADVSEGYIVEVYEDAVLFNGTNLSNNKTMPQCCYIIPTDNSSEDIPTTEKPTEKPVDPADTVTITLKSSGSDTDWVLNSTDRYVQLVDTDKNETYKATLTSAGWTVTVPASVKNITFNRVKNNAISHTWLAGNRGTDTNYFITGDARGHWENEVIPDYADVYLSGDFNTWDTGDAFIKTEDANVVTRTLTLNPNTYEFKIIKGSTWLGNSGTINNTTTTSSQGGWIMTSDAGNCTLEATGGTYTFNFNTSTNKLIVLHNPETEIPTTVPVTTIPTTEKPTETTTSAPIPTPEYKFGDVDLNDAVNVKDATAIQKHSASLITLEGKALTQADVNADSSVNVKDATAIQKFVAGIINAFPADKTKDTASTGALAPHFARAKQVLEDYYTYSSYDQYAALKYEFRIGSFERPDAEAQELLLKYEEALLKTVSDIGGTVSPEELGEINIYFSNNKNWSNVYAYVWGSAGNGPAWPGTAMTKTTTNSQGEDVYHIIVDISKYQNIIFTNGSGTQTEDIVIVAKDNTGYYISGGSSNKLTCETYSIII